MKMFIGCMLAFGSCLVGIITSARMIVIDINSMNHGWRFTSHMGYLAMCIGMLPIHALGLAIIQTQMKRKLEI